jgi:hypothetical protein
MLNYQAWLERTNVVRILLVEIQPLVSGISQTLYLSTHPATVGGTTYQPIVKNSISINENLSLDYAASISFGDIEIANNNGINDTWLNYIWKNRSVKVYYGSLPLPGAAPTLSNDFELVFDGVTVDIDSKSRDVLNIKIRDKLEKLNTPVTEALLGNYFQGNIVNETVTVNQNRNNLKPLVLGEVHNISPLLTDPTQLEFMVNAGPIERIVEVLDNGVPVSFTTIQQSGTPALPAGSFRLVAPLQGTCTASVQGVAKTINVTDQTYTDVYNSSISNTILTLLKLYGKQLDYNEIDAQSFSSLGSQSCGYYVNNRTNILALCQELAKSAGLTVSVTRTGKVKLIELAVPVSSTGTVTITEDEMFLNSFKISNKPDVIGAVKLGYAKNYTVLTGLVTGIPEEHKDLFAKEYLEVIAKNAAIISSYNLETEPVLEGTSLINTAQAQAVADSKLNLFKTPRTVYSFSTISKYMNLEVGSKVTLVSTRFGLNSGKPGLVIGTKPNWLAGKIELEVLI